jgi:hypothetical protein
VIDAVGKKRGMSPTGAGATGADGHDASRSSEAGVAVGAAVVEGAAVVVGCSMMVVVEGAAVVVSSAVVGTGSDVAGVVAVLVLVTWVEAGVAAVSLPQEAIRSTPTAAGAVLIMIVDMDSSGWSSGWNWSANDGRRSFAGLAAIRDVSRFQGSL